MTITVFNVRKNYYRTRVKRFIKSTEKPTNRHFHERCNVILTEFVPHWLQVLHAKNYK